MIPCVYILLCSDGSYYTGSTVDTNRRLWQHQNGQGARYTAKRLPVILVYQENYMWVEDAFKREKQIQGWSKAKKIALINSDANLLHELARCKNNTWSGRNDKNVTDS